MMFNSKFFIAAALSAFGTADARYRCFDYTPVDKYTSKNPYGTDPITGKIIDDITAYGAFVGAYDEKTGQMKDFENLHFASGAFGKLYYVNLLADEYGNLKDTGKIYEIKDDKGNVMGTANAVLKIMDVAELAEQKLSALENPMDEAQKIILNEFEVNQKLSGSSNPHPNIAQAFGMRLSPIDTSNRDAQTALLVLEICHGHELEDIIAGKKGKTLSDDDKFAIADQLTSAVAEMESHLIFNADIKPQNSIYDAESKTLKLIDFGMSSILHHSKEKQANTRGTKLYMSPEIVNHQKFGLKADVWASGVFLHRVFTGETMMSPGRGVMTRAQRARKINNNIRAYAENPKFANDPTIALGGSEEMTLAVQNMLVVDPENRPFMSAIRAELWPLVFKSADRDRDQVLADREEYQRTLRAWHCINRDEFQNLLGAENSPLQSRNSSLQSLSEVSTSSASSSVESSSGEAIQWSSKILDDVAVYTLVDSSEDGDTDVDAPSKLELRFSKWLEKVHDVEEYVAQVTTAENGFSKLDRKGDDTYEMKKLKAFSAATRKLKGDKWSVRRGLFGKTGTNEHVMSKRTALLQRWYKAWKDLEPIITDFY
jgi:serine/threonine protein kinase